MLVLAPVAALVSQVSEIEGVVSRKILVGILRWNLERSARRSGLTKFIIVSLSAAFSFQLHVCSEVSRVRRIVEGAKVFMIVLRV